MVTFIHLLFCHFEQETNYIWSLAACKGRHLTKLLFHKQMISSSHITKQIVTPELLQLDFPGIPTQKRSEVDKPDCNTWVTYS